MKSNITLNFRLFFLPIVVLLIGICFIVGALPPNETVAPTDILVSHPFWQNLGFGKVEVENPHRTDIIDGKIPGLKGLKKLYKKDKAISKRYLLNPYSLVFIIAEDDAFGYYLSIILKLLIAALGVYYLLFACNVWEYACYFGAFTYAFCGFITGWIFWEQADVSSFIPWLFWAILLFVQKGKWQYIFPISLFTFLLIIVWFPSVAAYGFYAASLFSLILILYYKQAIGDKVKCLFFIHLAILLGFIPALYLLGNMISKLGFWDFSTIETVTECVYNGITSELTKYDLSYRMGTTTPLQFKDFILLINPLAFGEPFPEKSFFCGKIALICALIYIPLMGIIQRKIDLFAKVLGITAVILFFSSIIIGWGLINHDLIRAIPTFSFNPWNRIVVITCFSIAILASLTIDFLRTTFYGNHKKLFISLFVVLSSFQLFELKTFFQEYNAVTDSRMFFPKTKSIDYLAANTGRFQRILHDNSIFYFNGALRYYGLNDWFDHSFKSKPLQKIQEELIKGHASSPTSSSFKLSQVTDFSNPLFDLLCIKYLASTDSTVLMERFPKLSIAQNVPLVLKQNQPITQTFSLSETHNSQSLLLKFGTYEKNPLVVNKIKIDIRQHHQILLEKEYVANRLFDNKWAEFPFDTSIKLQKDSSYTISFTLLSAENLVLWENEMSDWKFQFTGRNDATDWNKFKVENKVFIYENIDVPEIAYIVDDLNTRIINKEETEKINFQTKEGGRIIIINGKDIKPNKWLVVANKLISGKRFFDSKNNCLEMTDYLGIFPAVRTELSQDGIFILRQHKQ